LFAVIRCLKTELIFHCVTFENIFHCEDLATVMSRKNKRFYFTWKSRYIMSISIMIAFSGPHGWRCAAGLV